MLTRLNQVQRRVVVELSVLAALTVVFLFVFSRRPAWVNVALAVFSVALLALNARYTRNVVWGQFPPALDRRSCVQKSWMFAGPATGIVVIVFLATGLTLGYLEGGWETATRRVSNWHIVPVLALYFPWAFLQQTLFQFYLLGRLSTVFPAPVAVICTGVAYSLVHLPDFAVTAVTAVAGVCWTYIYYRFRVVSPLALSHALLGSTFYFWVYGKDLVSEWPVSL